MFGQLQDLGVRLECLHMLFLRYLRRLMFQQEQHPVLAGAERFYGRCSVEWFALAER